MQAVFFLSLFSLIFLMFSSITAGMGRNIMQANVENVKRTSVIFSEIENAINVLAFKQKDSSGRAVIDLSNTDLTDLDGTFLSEHIPYTKKQISKDPWDKEVKLFQHTKQEAIWGAAGGQIAKAPISTIMLLSSGPNGVYDTLSNLGLPQTATSMTEAQLKTTDITDKSIIGDDIITRFNTYDAMLDIWEKAEKLDNSVKNVSYDYYRARLDAFSPLIQLAERDTSNNGLLSSDVFGTLDPTEGYTGFDELISDNTAFSTKWNVRDTTPGSMNEKLRLFSVAKAYSGEFTLSSDSTLNTQLTNEFNSKYSGVDFLYPSFSAVSKDSNGNNLPAVQTGLQNLGISNMSSLDPFDGNGSALDYEYSTLTPHIINIIRKDVSSDQNKWSVSKTITVDGLGEV